MPQPAEAIREKPRCGTGLSLLLLAPKGERASFRAAYCLGSEGVPIQRPRAPQRNWVWKPWKVWNNAWVVAEAASQAPRALLIAAPARADATPRGSLPSGRFGQPRQALQVGLVPEPTTTRWQLLRGIFALAVLLGLLSAIVYGAVVALDHLRSGVAAGVLTASASVLIAVFTFIASQRSDRKRLSSNQCVSARCRFTTSLSIFGWRTPS
jgi:hypothetical protein